MQANNETTTTTPYFTGGERDSIRRQLLEWYDQEKRSMPWRDNPSEYRTVVSEFMLQQTRVDTALPYFERFTARFPGWRALAEADEQDVLNAWSGLGYYRRARMLKRAAETVHHKYGGKLPRDAKKLAALPGFGEYTTGAVGSIALGMALPLVDGNVRRVVGRLRALEGPLNAGPGKQALWDVCTEMVDPERPGDFNQALMELGATVCSPQDPMCLVCPVFAHCQARAKGDPTRYSGRIERPPLRIVQEIAVVLTKEIKGREQILLLRRGESGSFSGMWELPRLDEREIEEDELTPERVLFEVVRIRPRTAESIGEAESSFTHHKIKTRLFKCPMPPRAAVRRQRHVQHEWIRPEEFEKLPSSKAQRRLLELALKKE